MKRQVGCALVSIVSILLPILSPVTANAAGLADCLYVTNAKFTKSTFNTTYELTLNTQCDSKTSEKLNWSGVTFYADKNVLNGSTDTYYYSLFGSTLKFNLTSWEYSALKPGTQYPYLKIFSPSDYSYKTIYLPTFEVAEPMECVSVASSGSKVLGTQASYEVVLKNTCSSLGEREFSDLKFSISVPGYTGYVSSQTLYSLSKYGSTITFNLPGIQKGSYFPSLQILDTGWDTKNLSLNSFVIQGSGQSGTGSTLLQNCISSPGMSTQCAPHPNLTFDMCSSLKNGTLQEKVGTKWITLWKVSGAKDLSSCDSKYPFFVSVSGQNSRTSSTSMRIVFAGTSSMTGYTQSLTMKAVKK
jgi:hypothetical protein